MFGSHGERRPRSFITSITAGAGMVSSVSAISSLLPFGSRWRKARAGATPLSGIRPLSITKLPDGLS